MPLRSGLEAPLARISVRRVLGGLVARHGLLDFTSDVRTVGRGRFIETSVPLPSGLMVSITEIDAPRVKTRHRTLGRGPSSLADHPLHRRPNSALTTRLAVHRRSPQEPRSETPGQR